MDENMNGSKDGTMDRAVVRIIIGLLKKNFKR